MFAKHEIVDVLSKRLNKQRLCSLHNEPFIMFNAEDKVGNSSIILWKWTITIIFTVYQSIPNINKENFNLLHDDYHDKKCMH